jgi:hypothetical protein
MTAINSSKVVEYSSSVVGFGMALDSRLKISARFSAFIKN